MGHIQRVWKQEEAGAGSRRLRSYSRAFPLGIVVLALALPGCQRTPSSSPAGPSGPAPGGVAARVNGTDIPHADVEKYYQARIFDLQQKPSGDAANIIRLELLNDLITGELMTQKARQLNLRPTDAEIDAEVTILRGAATEEEFHNSMQQRGLSEADLRRDIVRNLTTQKVVENQIGPRSQITEAEIQAFYEENKESFLIAEPQYRVGLIAVAENPPPGAANPGSQGSARIREAAARLRAGEDFHLIARQFSDDPQTAPVGGDLGYLPAAGLDRLGAGPKAAVLRLPVGDVTPVLTVPGGFVLLKLLGRREPGQLTLENAEVRHILEQELRGRRDEVLRLAFTAQLRGEARIENFLAQQILAGSPPAN